MKSWLNWSDWLRAEHDNSSVERKLSQVEWPGALTDSDRAALTEGEERVDERLDKVFQEKKYKLIQESRGKVINEDYQPAL